MPIQKIFYHIIIKFHTLIWKNILIFKDAGFTAGD